MSRLITNAIRSTSASADAITMDGSGNATFPANVTCSGTATGFGGGKLVNYGSVIKTDTFSQSLGQAVWSNDVITLSYTCLLYTSPSPRDLSTSRMPSSA